MQKSCRAPGARNLRRKPVEIARFTQLWKKEASGWKLSRVLSYDHKLTE